MISRPHEEPIVVALADAPNLAHRTTRLKRWMRTATREELEHWAETAIRDAAAALSRSRALAVEREADHIATVLGVENPTKEMIEAARKTIVQAREKSAADRDKMLAKQKAYADARREIATRALKIAFGDFAESVRTAWTKELLGQPFAMPDGTPVIWAEATIEQHQTRIDMLDQQAVASVEAAARHRQAIELIQKLGVHTLGEAMTA